MQPLSGRTQAVTISFILIIIADLAAALSDLSIIGFIIALNSGFELDLSLANLLDAAQSLTGIIQLLLLPVTAIAFLAWFYRSRNNLDLAGLHNLKYSSGWAIGSFFVPFLNLVRPYQIMKDVWRGSVFVSGTSSGSSWQDESLSPLIPWWWTLYLLSSFIGNISGRLLLRSETPSEILTAEGVTLVADLTHIGAAIIALLLVRAITEFQEQARQTIHSPITALPNPSQGNP